MPIAVKHYFKADIFILPTALANRDIPDSAFIAGISGKQKGWMSRHGYILKADKDGFMVCLESGFRYKEVSPGTLKCLDLNEEDPFPELLAKGKEDYRQIKEKGKK